MWRRLVPERLEVVVVGGGPAGFLDQPDLFFVGHNYDATGGLHNINRDSRPVARLLGCEVRRAGPKWDGLARNGAVTLPIPHP